MKRLISAFLCFMSVFAFGFTLSEEGEKESIFLNNYIDWLYCKQESDKKDCLVKLENLLSQNSDSKELKREMVNSAVELNDLEIAAKHLDYIEMEPKNTADDFAIYATYFSKKGDETGDYAQAISALEKAIELEPDNSKNLLMYMWHLLKTDRKKLQEFMDSQEKVNPLLISDVYAQIGNLYLQVNEVQNAYGSYQKSLQLDKNNIQAKLGLVDVYEKAEQYFLMLHELEELEKDGYQEPEFYAKLGAAFVLVNDLEKAEHYFLKSKELDNSNIRANYFLSLLAEKKGDYEKAIKYQIESANYATVSSKWIQVSYYLDRLGRNEESLKLLRKASLQFPEDKEVLFYYAVALQDAKKFRKSAKILKNLVEKNPSHIESRLYYAYALESLKKYKDMEQQLNIIFINNPDYAAALNLFAYSLAQRGERLTLAKEYIAKALSSRPNEYSYQDTQAWVYFKLGQYDDCLNLLLSIPDNIVAENTEIAYHLGATYEKIGDKENSLKYLSIAKDEWPEAMKLYKKLQK